MEIWDITELREMDIFEVMDKWNVVQHSIYLKFEKNAKFSLLNRCFVLFLSWVWHKSVWPDLQTEVWAAVLKHGVPGIGLCAQTET